MLNLSISEIVQEKEPSGNTYSPSKEEAQL
jgi:hypothetical protein